MFGHPRSNLEQLCRLTVPKEASRQLPENNLFNSRNGESQICNIIQLHVLNVYEDIIWIFGPKDRDVAQGWRLRETLSLKVHQYICWMSNQNEFFNKRVPFFMYIIVYYLYIHDNYIYKIVNSSYILIKIGILKGIEYNLN